MSILSRAALRAVVLVALAAPLGCGDNQFGQGAGNTPDSAAGSDAADGGDGSIVVPHPDATTDGHDASQPEGGLADSTTADSTSGDDSGDDGSAVPEAGDDASNSDASETGPGPDGSTDAAPGADASDGAAADAHADGPLDAALPEACSPDPRCTVAGSTCSGTGTLVTCAVGPGGCLQVTATSPCSNGACYGAAGSAQCCTNECATAGSSCDGSGNPVTCAMGPNGCLVKTTGSCGGATPTCNAGTCTSACGGAGNGTCGAGYCCNAGTCAAVSDTACGPSGGTCSDCSQSLDGIKCVAGHCGCNNGASDCLAAYQPACILNTHTCGCLSGADCTTSQSGSACVSNGNSTVCACNAGSQCPVFNSCCDMATPTLGYGQCTNDPTNACNGSTCGLIGDRCCPISPGPQCRTGLACKVATGGGTRCQ